MDQQKKIILSALLCGLPLAYGPALYAAKPIDLAHQKISILQSVIAGAGETRNALGLKEINRDLDFKKTLHIRVQQTYMDYPIWGADAVIHIPQGENTSKDLAALITTASAQKGFMNGTIYQDLQTDLANAPASLFDKTLAQKALQQSIEAYRQKVGHITTAKEQTSDLIVFIDSDNKAHWAYQVSFYVEPINTSVTPARPIYIIDALTSQIYKQWDDIKTAAKKVATPGGGFGGNEKMGKLVYDGLTGDLAKLDIQRTAKNKTCYLQNTDVTVSNYNDNKIMSFACAETNPDHNNLYWSGDFDAVNGGYSPGNDALSAGIVIKHMYQDWYGIPVLTKADHKTPMMLNMVVHVPQYENAYWDGSKMTFGDGASMFYPLTSLGVGAHEISHGFTEQHSNLTYDGQSGGMNEAFSDMAAQAAEFYSYGKNSWQIGPEIFKAQGEALRYMDKPSKDCDGKTPGDWCSIDDASEYKSGLDVHFSSGVYNHFFYLLGTTEGWDAKKAFDVMVQANAHYWTKTTTFSSGACGVINAAQDLAFSVDDVKKAFDGVKVDYSKC